MHYKKNLYFDSNSYYMPNKDIIKEILKEDLLFLPLNPSSTHRIGQYAHKILEDSREFILSIMSFIDMSDDEFMKNNIYHDELSTIESYIKKNLRGICSFFDLIFLSSSTESNNLIIDNAVSNLDCDVLICSAGEHASVLEKFIYYKQNSNKIIEIIDIESISCLDQESLYEMLYKYIDKKIFISLIYINNETGVMNDLKNIICKARKIHKNLIIHSDFSQAVGKIKQINLSALDIDFISFSGYKFGGLNGASCFYFIFLIKH